MTSNKKAPGARNTEGFQTHTSRRDSDTGAVQRQGRSRKTIAAQTAIQIQTHESVYANQAKQIIGLPTPSPRVGRDAANGIFQLKFWKWRAALYATVIMFGTVLRACA